MKYKSYDEQYNDIVKEILENGVTDSPETVRTVYEDGTKATTKSIINVQLKLDNSTDKIQILTTKRVGFKDCIKEIFWIWQLMSNKVQDLRDMGCNVWNEWENENGDIGRAYGWQLRNKLQPITVDKLFFEMYFSNQFFSKPAEKDLNLTTEEIENFCNGKYEVSLNQVDYLLYQLKKNPHSRRHRTTLWAVEDLHLMSLQPCVHSTTWTVQGDVLHLTVDIRSNDMGCGNSYNVTQLAVLHRLVAQVSNLKVGEICFNIANAHIYDRHFDLIEKQIQGEIHEAPTIWINPEVKSFYDFTLDDIKIENYIHNGSFKYEIAI